MKSPKAIKPEQVVLEVLPRNANPRNSEGAFINLKDGMILFAWTKFTGAVGGDHGSAVIACRQSEDDGKTWSKRDRVLVENEGACNVMSVSFLRLQDGRIALFYLRKDTADTQCRLFMRTSADEAKSWSEPRLCMHLDGYFVVNNDRVIQLKSGRIIAPSCSKLTMYVKGNEGKGNGRDIARYFYSDDSGENWNEMKNWSALPDSGSFQEPGMIELKNQRLYSWGRTGTGCQWGHYSYDMGETWTGLMPTGFTGPCSPLSMKRIPETGDLLAVWNHHCSRYGLPKPAFGSANRTPLVSAISSDEGVTWKNHKLIESDPAWCFSYIAIGFTNDKHVLLAYGAGKQGKPGESSEGLRQRVRRIPVSWF